MHPNQLVAPCPAGSLEICNCPKFHLEIPFLHPGRGDLILVGHLKESDLVTSGIRFGHFKESDFVNFKESDFVNFKESDFVK